MPILNPIESRSLSSGLAQRTIKNLAFIQKAHQDGKDVHVVMQVVNSLLSLLVFPVEKEKAFFNSFKKIKLSNPPDFRAVANQLAGFPALSSLRRKQFENCTDLSRFFKRTRNAISHKRLEFSSESHDLKAVLIRLQDAELRKPVDWDIQLSAEDLLALSLYVAQRIIGLHL